MYSLYCLKLVETWQFGARVAEPFRQWRYSCAHLLCGEAVNRCETNLCWPSTCFVLNCCKILWLMSERDAPPLVALSEVYIHSFNSSTEYFSWNDELSEPASPELNGLIPEGNSGFNSLSFNSLWKEAFLAFEKYQGTSVCCPIRSN